MRTAKNAADADAYLARLAAMAKAADNDTDRQRADAAKGGSRRTIFDTTLKLLGDVRDVEPAKTVMVASFAKKPATANLPADRAGRAETIVRDQVFPALDRQQSPGQGTPHEGGARCRRVAAARRRSRYAVAAEGFTTVSMTGDEIHKLGLEQVAEISARIDGILKGQGMSQGTVGERLVELNKRPDQLYPNTDQGKEQLLEQLRAQVAAMYKRLPEAFATLPKAPVEVRRVPPSIQAGAPGGYYQNATLDGSRPGIYFINLRDTFDRPKFGLANSLSHHEAVPGHHMQVMLAMESTEIPFTLPPQLCYGEGWALYTEQLADEMGMFDGDPLGQVGYLQSLLFRATRLVVDSGMHVKRWSREQATDWFMAHTGIARGRSQGEIDRYTIHPGQACSYKIGHTAWVRLRDETKQRQGDRFDLKQFHDVLRLGAMPLSVLERVVRERFA